MILMLKKLYPRRYTDPYRKGKITRRALNIWWCSWECIGTAFVLRGLNFQWASISVGLNMSIWLRTCLAQSNALLTMFNFRPTFTWINLTFDACGGGPSFLAARILNRWVSFCWSHLSNNNKGHVACPQVISPNRYLFSRTKI